MNNEVRQRKKNHVREQFQLVRDEPTKFEYEKDFSIMEVFKTFIGLIILNFAISYFVTGTWFWASESKLTNFQYLKHVATNPYTHDSLVLTEQDLAKFSGSLYNANDKDHDRIYLAVNGTVYDVTGNPSSYGPLGSYVFFTGTDAARAFVTGCFKTDLTHDLRGLDNTEDVERVVKGWQKFFENSKKYWKVGTVIHPSLEGTPIPPPCKNGHSQPGGHAYAEMKKKSEPKKLKI